MREAVVALPTGRSKDVQENLQPLTQTMTVLPFFGQLNTVFESAVSRVSFSSTMKIGTLPAKQEP